MTESSCTESHQVLCSDSSWITRYSEVILFAWRSVI